jgi:ADP-heptose:LPS heptosyltransferase
LLKDHPQLDDLIIVPRRWKDVRAQGGFAQVVGRLRSRRWDAVLDLQGLAKSGFLSWLSGARLRVGLGGPDSREGNGLFMHRRSPVPVAGTNIVRINLSVLGALGLDPEGIPATAVLPDRDEDREPIVHWARTTGIDGERFLVLDPFAGWETKIWPTEKWGETLRVAQKLTGLRTLVLYGPSEALQAEELAGVLRRNHGVECMLAPPTTLGQASALLRGHAHAFLGGDTGPAHMAAALGVPTVVIFGPSCNQRNSPDFAGARFRTLQDRSHPCTNTFRRKCPLHQAPGHCMDRTNPDQVMEALRSVLGDGA